MKIFFIKFILQTWGLKVRSYIPQTFSSKVRYSFDFGLFAFLVVEKNLGSFSYVKTRTKVLFGDKSFNLCLYLV